MGKRQRCLKILRGRKDLEKPNTYIKPSKIHGVGLFAAVKILRGEEIVHGGPNYNVFQDEWIEYNKRGDPSFNLKVKLCCINHSEFPNCSRKGLSTEEQLIIFATRDIEENEEITEDYNLLADWNNPFAKNHVSAVLDNIINSPNFKNYSE